VREAIGRRVDGRGGECLRLRAALIERDRSGIRGSVRGFLHRAPRGVELAGVDRETDHHQHREQHDGDEDHRLTDLGLCADEELP